MVRLERSRFRRVVDGWLLLDASGDSCPFPRMVSSQTRRFPTQNVADIWTVRLSEW